jgi:hypothetical protein
MTTQEFLEDINDFIGPVSPFDDEDYSDPATIPNRRKNWFEKQNVEDVANCLVEVISKQPPCLWPERENFYHLEICEIASFLKHTIYAQYILTAITPYLLNPEKRFLIIKVIGYLGLQEGIKWLKKLNSEEMKDKELMYYADSLNMIGGENAIKALNDLKSKVPKENYKVHNEIDIALKYPYENNI